MKVVAMVIDSGDYFWKSPKDVLRDYFWGEQKQSVLHTENSSSRSECLGLAWKRCSQSSSRPMAAGDVIGVFLGSGGREIPCAFY